ncbi:UNVERIFIED_CONTAM: hypothetical protein PYX00_001071 [Menopon gallinae]|uniref:VPS37 C-terminal domain-containing protein n=1 Tax=Menopon gallinae TaxID=328185 RepID=A0AAW2IBE0_9NEOP
MLSRIFRDDVENKQANRKRQIDTLKVFNDNVTEIKEDAEYRVDFIAGDIPMCLHISLPLEFPNEKPQIIVQPPVQHPWVNDRAETKNAPGLLNFTVHSDLGRVVQVIIREFQNRPPPVITMGHTSNPSTSGLPVPPVVCSVPELLTLSISELQLINEDDDYLDEFIMSLRLYQDYSELVDRRINEVEAIARDNLSKQGKLEKLRKKVIKRVEQAQKLKTSFDEKHKEYEKLCERYHPESIREVLRLAAIQSDEESEMIAERFLNNEIDIEQFLNQYIEKRKISQIRKTKEEKLSNQLKELQKAGY